MNTHQVSEYLASRILAAEVLFEPWPHITIPDALPSDAYEELLDRMTLKPTADMEGRLIDMLCPRDPFYGPFSSFAVRAALRERLGFGGTPSPRIVCDQIGYQYPVHPDIDRKAGTIQIYMTRGTVLCHGTKLWSRDAKRLIKEIPFAPNMGYAFARGEDTFHSLGPFSADRWSLLVPYMRS